MDILFLGGVMNFRIWPDQREDLQGVKVPVNPQKDIVIFWTDPPLELAPIEVQEYKRALSTNLTDELVRQHTGLTIFRLVGTPS